MPLDEALLQKPVEIHSRFVEDVCLDILGWEFTGSGLGRLLLSPGREFGLARNSDAPGADKFLDPERFQHIDQSLNLVHITRHLYRIGGRGRINDFGSENIRDPYSLVPVVRSGVNFDQGGFPVQVTRLRHVYNLEHLDHLVQLFHDLFNDPFIASRHNRDHRGRRIQGGSYGEAFNIIAPGAEQASDPGQHAKLIFY